MPDSNRMRLSESKLTPTVRRLRLRFLLKYNCDNVSVVLIRFRLFKNRARLGIPKRRNACHVRYRTGFAGPTGPSCRARFPILKSLRRLALTEDAALVQVKGNFQ